MHSHNRSAFNNSCLKVPRNVKIDQPLPQYEQKFVYQFENEAKKLGMTADDIGIAKKKFVDKEGSQSFMNFISNIPEYDDINHLSNKEFYKKLDNLKEKQKLFEEYIQHDIKFDAKDSEWIEDYKNLKMGTKKVKCTKKKSLKPFCTTPILNKHINVAKTPDFDVDVFSDKEISNKPPSRRSVRIETPSEKLFSYLTPEPRSKSRANFSTNELKTDNWDNLSLERLNLDSERRSPLILETRSAPCSPTRSKSNVNFNDGGVTIPKPFQMTVRDEENKIVEELYLKMPKPKEPKPEQFKAHDIPIESQVPLFDRIMADQERRSFITKQRRKATLQAQMKPFSFTKRDEEIQELTKELSKSSPDLFSEPPLKIKKFKAKPIPKNLFSNYIYRKMHEDEFYRALQKKIRSEELLKASSLPPSMAKRERSKHKFDVCPRLYKETEKIKTPKSKRSSPFNTYQDRLERELEELKNEYIGISPRQMKTKISKKGEKGGRRNYRNSSASSKSSSSKSPSSASYDLSSINRSNLAAVLRIQSARKKLDMEMIRRLEEAKLKEEARWREKLMRKKPVWQALAYSHEEDLAMRLQLRRDEEKLRREEHQMRMQLMLGRVHQQPTLFERQSQVKCFKTRDELVSQLYQEYHKKKTKGEKYPTYPTDMKSFIEMKDEAIQVLLDENDTYGETGRSRESESIEEKEECDCSSDEK